jgi:hypothetical protein
VSGRRERHRAPETAPLPAGAPTSVRLPATPRPLPEPPAPYSSLAPAAASPPPALLPAGGPGPAPGWRLSPTEELDERHQDELDRDRRVERRLTWHELGCLLLVVLVLLVRERYLR